MYKQIFYNKSGFIVKMILVMMPNEYDIILISKSLCSKDSALLNSSEILKLKLCICIICMF